MDEMKLEQRLRSWNPRRPSPRIEERLFGAAATTNWVRGADLWRWLTPLAACALTLLVQAARQPASPSDGANGTGLFATLMVNASSSNVASCSLSRGDENVEWNIWPHAFRNVELASSDRSSLIVRPSIIPPTNR